MRFGAQSEEAHKIGQFGTRMKMRSRMSTGCRAISLFSVFFLRHIRVIYDYGTNRKGTEGTKGQGEKGRSTNAVKYHSS